MSGGHRFMRASAGTGKTYQLVQAYVGHVEAGVSPSAIVAITFTRKAAAELRSRIRNELVKRNVSREHLDALARAPIANFHGLALQMLQNIGAAVGFTDVPTIMGDLNEDQRMFRVACEEAWYGADASAKAALADIATRMRVGGGGRAEPLIDTVWGAIAVAREDDDPRALAERFVGYDAEGTRASVHAELVAARQSLAARIGELGAKSKGREQLEAFLACDVPGKLDDLRAWELGWRRAFACLKGARLGPIGLDAPERDRLLDLLGVPTAERLCAELAPSLQTLVIAAMQRYDAMKHETRSVDFADLLERVGSMLEGDKALHAQVRERFKVVLVDEAQDTNASQRRFVHLIAGLVGPAGIASGAEPATLFVVGDRKQSIYTFRGADPRSFDKFEEDLVGLSASLEQLDVSRRSSGAVVRAVNALGRATLESYEPLDVLPGRAEVEDGVTWLVPEAPPAGGVSADAEARCVARYVRGAVDRGVEPSAFAILLRATTKAPRFARALAALGVPSVITGGGGFYVQSEIVDVVSFITWLTDPEAHYEAAVALRSPLIGMSDAALLHLFQSKNRAGLKALRRGDTAQFGSSYAGDHVVARALADKLPRLVAAAANGGAGALLADVMDALDVRAALLALPFGEQKVANVERLLELAYHHERTSRRGVAHFAQMQREHARRNALEPLRAVGAARDRAVAIMTVHQSKGLEFEHVIVADVAQERSGGASRILYGRDRGFVFAPDRQGGDEGEGRFESSAYAQVKDAQRNEEKAETKRLLYVATTRARERLTFVCLDDAKKTGFARELIPWRANAGAEGLIHTVRESDLPEVTTTPPVRSAPVRVLEAAVAPAPLAEPAPEPRSSVKAPRRAGKGGQLDLFGNAWPAPAGPARPEPIVPARPVVLDAPKPKPRLINGLPDLRFTSAPPGSRFAIAVTEIEQALSGASGAAPAFKRQAVQQALVDDTTLDPLTRGRLSHMVLAAMHRLALHATLEHFVDAELRLCGYDPADPRLEQSREDLVGFLSSPLGQEIARLAPADRRHELPFVLRFDVDSYVATVSGQIDLVYWQDGAPTIVDYKHARSGDTPATAYTTQLDAYASAVAKLCDFDGPIRSRLVFLKDPAGGRGRVRERIVTAAMRAGFRDSVDALVRHRAAPTSANSLMMTPLVS